MGDVGVGHIWSVPLQHSTTRKRSHGAATQDSAGPQTHMQASGDVRRLSAAAVLAFMLQTAEYTQ